PPWLLGSSGIHSRVNNSRPRRIAAVRPSFGAISTSFAFPETAFSISISVCAGKISGGTGLGIAGTTWGVSIDACTTGRGPVTALDLDPGSPTVGRWARARRPRAQIETAAMGQNAPGLLQRHDRPLPDRTALRTEKVNRAPHAGQSMILPSRR